MNWFDSLQVFENIAETQSFVGAARALGLPNSVVTKRIQWLERELQCSLLVRTTRKVSLSEAGEHLLRKVKPILSEWGDLHSQLVDYQSQPHGEIKLCTVPTISRMPIFMNVFTKFLDSHPAIQLDLITTHQPIRLSDATVDVFIGTERYILDPSQAVGVNLFEFQYQCYASPEYIAIHGQPKNPNEIINHNCITLTDFAQWDFGGKQIMVEGNMRVDTGETVIQACIAGLGLIYAPNYILQEKVKDKQLVPILASFHGKKQRIKVYYLKRDYKPRKIELLIDLLRKNLKS